MGDAVRVGGFRRKGKREVSPFAQIADSCCRRVQHPNANYADIKRVWRFGKLTDAMHSKRLMNDVVDKCKIHQIEGSIKKLDFEDIEYVEISLNDGRGKRQIILVENADLELALSSNFQDYVFLENYAAIASYKHKTIEATFGQVGSGRPGFINSTACKILFGSEEIDSENSRLEFANSNNGSSIELSVLSDVAYLLLLTGRRGRRAVSIKITLQALNGHDHALSILNKLANSLFFQIDNQSRILLQLNRIRHRRRMYLRNRSKAEIIDLQFPRMEYDSGPISLFWYARSADGMPLLQFLAFYQVIEYYYPTFFQLEARNMIRNIMKDPNFRGDRDADIGRILSIMSTGGRGFGSERSQLRATLNACLNPQELRAFLEENSERKDFFSAKQKGLSDRRILTNDKDADLRDHVADLIYDIRCRIVHTKGDGDKEVELLLPFSEEADRLFHDIELIEWIAKRVLMAASVEIAL